MAERIVDRVLQDRSRTPRFGRPALTVDDFHHFLFSEDLNPPIRHSKVYIGWSLEPQLPKCRLIYLVLLR